MVPKRFPNLEKSPWNNKMASWLDNFAKVRLILCDDCRLEFPDLKLETPKFPAVQLCLKKPGNLYFRLFSCILWFFKIVGGYLFQKIPVFPGVFLQKTPRLKGLRNTTPTHQPSFRRSQCRLGNMCHLWSACWRHRHLVRHLWHLMNLGHIHP